MTTSNVERLREIVARMRAAVPQSTNNVWTVFKSREQCKAFFEAQAALLEIAEVAEKQRSWQDGNLGDLVKINRELDEALAKFNSLKIEGL